ncbi:sorting nexin-11 [Myxocyprinus asiaticus]|uniref:sorting nexin-11 n=1 Tax=Myxocyprinus asiaticus TaxID=70543 RepID=UPI002222E3E8|nr:sorting nexin-11 [Myxocyprinus asiaticus]XP_051524143.1 sorting nexin-11 [Myxocyprinus asiaticus]
MIRIQEQDEFIAVRVQDPRVQNEGSWNSYVDFKIFLHTNSKAFTAKTSCVRRRYSEFVWLKKKLQKNAGLVPVPDLPKKSLFSFINDDFIERRRMGLQSFLDKVLHMTVCLSDSQLHLFLQTQLPVKHIEDCVQGHTPYTVTEAILTYASSKLGWVQEEGGGSQELWPAPVPYESVESPAPHLPSFQCVGTTSSGIGTPNELTDVSDLETESILSDAEQTAPVLKYGNCHERIVKERESSINLVVEVHPTTLLSFIETEFEVENCGSDETQWLYKKSKDLQGYGCEYPVSHIDGLLEDKSWHRDSDSKGEGLDKVPDQETSVKISSVDRVIEKRTLGDINEGERDSQDAALKQECTVRQTPDKDLHEEDPSPMVHYNKVTLNLSVAQEDTAEQSDLRGQELVETAAKTGEDHELHDLDSIIEDITPYNEDQEQGKAEITVDKAVQENGVRDENSNIDAAVQEDATVSQNLDKDFYEEGSSIYYNEVTLDLSAKHSDQMRVENTTKTGEDVAFLDCYVAGILEEILPDTEDPELGKDK